MAFEIQATSFRQKDVERSQFARMLIVGGVAGFAALFFNFVGLMNQFHGRWILEGYLTLAHTTLILVALVSGAIIAQRSPKLTSAQKIVQGFLSGFVAAACVAALIGVMSAINIRFMFVAISPKLFQFLTMGEGGGVGALLQVIIGTALGGLGAALYVAPRVVRRPLVIALSSVFGVGLFSELLQLAMQYEGFITTVRSFFFTWEGMRLQGGAFIFVVVGLGMLFWVVQGERIRTHHAGMSTLGQGAVKYTGWAIALILFLLFPMAAGSFFGQVLMLVGLYVLMGMGLNLEIGLAGLLDLGFVAFFACGAYTVALFTADNEHLLLIFDRPLTWWEAMPLAMLSSLILGVLFGIPVLRVRGDYLAVATLGLGEIIRIVVLSDMASPLLGGSQGLLHIPRPWIGSFELNDPIYLFYLTLVSSCIAAYFAWALENSRLGRAWMAIREDEDVGQALGINLVNVKLLAYGLGAVFAGLAGAIFAVMLTSIFPHSFQLLISVNILALIIVGGLGSLPGVVVGGAMLIGTPELLREFGEYRFLAYGAVIIAMMRIKPLGLWPSAARKRELQTVDEAVSMVRGRRATSTEQEA